MCVCLFVCVRANVLGWCVCVCVCVNVGIVYVGVGPCMKRTVVFIH